MGARRRIAGWARTLTPARLTPVQRELLAPKRDDVSAVQQEAERLGGYTASPLWSHLSDTERHAVHAADYPLGISALARLGGLSISQVRYWEQNGLLPARRTKGGHRQFFAPAAIRALILRQVGPSGLTTLRVVHERRAGSLLASVAMVLHEQEAVGNQELYWETADRLQQVSLTMAES